MKLQFDSKIETDFAGVLAVRNKLLQRFGVSDFIGGEMQFAKNVPLSGSLNLNLEGLALESLSVECFLPKGEKSSERIKEFYQQLEPIVSSRYVFSVEFEFHAAIAPSKKKEYLSLSTVTGLNCELGLLSYHPTHRKEIMQQFIETAGVPVQITESGESWFVKSTPGFQIKTSATRSNGGNPMSLGWDAPQDISERFSVVERILDAIAGKEKGIKHSWKTKTILGGGTAEELVAIMNSANLTLPKGELSFSYVLKELEGLERMRTILGAKAKLRAQAAVFRWPEDDRGQLWVDTKPNGYQIQLHLDDGDRIKELQEYLGIEFDSGRESFL
jgi:hypothetical protein